MLFRSILIFFLVGPVRKTHSVCDVLKDPYKYSANQSLPVHGVVSDAVAIPFLFKGYYLKDEKGDCGLLVETDRFLPRNGTMITVVGRLVDPVRWGNNEFVVLVEKKSEK